jgi:hypothetical protein
MDPQTLQPSPFQTNPQENDIAQPGQGGRVLIIFIGIIVLVGIAGAWYYFTVFKKAPSSTPSTQQPIIKNVKEIALSPTPATDKFTEWKTYINDSFGISFNYPPHWNVNPTNANELTTIREESHKIEGDIELGTAKIIVKQTTDSLDEAIASIEGVEKKESITLGDNPATRMTGTEGIAGSMHFVTVISHYQGKNIIISVYTQDEMLFPVYTDEFNTILSTFKFKDANKTVDTANWKTFSGTAYNFSYPSEWIIVDDARGQRIYANQESASQGLPDYIMSMYSQKDPPQKITFEDKVGTKKETADNIYEEKKANFNIDDRPAFKVSTTVLQGSQTDGVPGVNVYIDTGENILVISMPNTHGVDEKIFDQIISSINLK